MSELLKTMTRFQKLLNEVLYKITNKYDLMISYILFNHNFYELEILIPYLDLIIQIWKLKGAILDFGIIY